MMSLLPSWVTRLRIKPSMCSTRCDIRQAFPVKLENTVSKQASTFIKCRLPRKTLRLNVGVYTGHNCLRFNRRVLGPINSRECSNRNEADETALHYLCYCSHYGAVRTRIWGIPFLHPSEVLHITVRDLLRFLTSSRRFS